MPKAFHRHQVSSLTFCILLALSSCWWNVNQAGASSAPTLSTVCGKWASSFRGATRPTRLDASGFSITSNSRQQRHLLPSSSSPSSSSASAPRQHSYSEHAESTSSAAPAAAAAAAGSGSMILHRHRGGAASASVKTMTARQMELSNLLSGGVAGTIAACLTNPLEVIKTQLQSSNTAVASSSSSSSSLSSSSSSFMIASSRSARRGHSSVVAVARRIMKADGLSGFLRGLPPTIVGIIPSRSAYFYAYHRSKHALGPYLAEGSPPNALVSGLLAGIVSNTLTNPIWMVRTRMQILADSAAGQVAYKGYGDAIATIFRDEGVMGFYKGIRASYWGCAEGSIQFIIYEQLKAKLTRRHNARRARKGLPPTDSLPVATYFWSAAAAKMLASITTYPHEVARTRIREQARAGVFKYKGMWQTLGVIAREEGRQGLYSGLGIHLLKVVPNSAFMFLTYEVVRMWLGEFTIVEEFEEKYQSQLQSNTNECRA